MEKMYAVAHDESGRYIGHGLYEEHQVIDGYYLTPEAADTEAKRLGPFHYAFEVEVKE